VGKSLIIFTKGAKYPETDQEPAVELDEEDLQLINALQIAPRAPWTHLGEVLDRHPTSLAARWDRLTASGAAWVNAHPLGDPQQMTLSFHDVQCDPARRQKVVAALAALPDVFTIEECYRNRDMMLTVLTPTTTWLVDSLYPQLDRIPGLIRYQSSFCTKLHYGAANWQLGTLSPAQQRKLRELAAPAMQYHGPLPASYADIIRQLARNGRATAAEIAEATGLHPATARRQLQRILNSRTMTFRCEVAQGPAGYPIICEWTGKLPAGDHAEAARVLAGFGGLRLCVSTTGDTNFMFMMWLRSAAEIMAVERAAEELIPRLDLVESVVIARVPKRVGWMLNADGTAAGDVVAPGDAWIP
jgi:DNA-binding Lrp family transcriptional regulator